jgi:hypothetical protein
MAGPTRGQRLQVMLTPLELRKVDDCDSFGGCPAAPPRYARS